MLLLLPNLLDPSNKQNEDFAIRIKNEVESLQGLFCESEKAGRIFLLRFLSREKANSLPLLLINEHTQDRDMKDLLAPLLKKEKWGLISDAGMPSLADPGEDLVFLARKNKIDIDVIMGPCSIIQALLLSGLSAERFSFHGYLPREENFLKKKILEMERAAHLEKMTQIFMETPYRVEKLGELLLKTLSDRTLLALAEDISLPSQKITVETVATWKIKSLSFSKKPSIFLLSF